MNPFDILKRFVCSCFRSHEHCRIIDYEDLPEMEKPIFNFYNKDKHVLLFCKGCKTINLIGHE